MWGMDAQKRAPALRGRAPSSSHVLGDGRLSHRKAELEQLTVNARRTPKRILSAHPPDQCLQIGIDPWSTSEAARFPPPIATKPSAMPAHDGRRPDDRDGLEDRRKPAIQLDEEQAVAVRELYAAAYLALQH